MGTELTVVHHQELAVRGEEEFSISRLVEQKAAIQRAMQAVMHQNEHYGVIPGTGSPDRPPKPSLFQPGADTLCFLFRLRADYETVLATEQDTFLAFTVRCRLFHIVTGHEWGSGLGSSNSREKKYSAQSTARLCPKCKKPTIIKGREEYGGGWLCFKKKGGCDAKWKDGDETIEGQTGEAQTNGVWDLHNTLWKMACKRAKVAAVLTATAASDCFTQDLEDLVEHIPAPPKSAVASATVEAAGTAAAAAVGGAASVSATSATPTATSEARGDANGAPADETQGNVTDEDINVRVPIYEWDERSESWQQVREEPRVSPGQLAKIHVLCKKLGHHLNRRITDPKTKKQSWETEGYLKQKLRETFGKDSRGELSTREAGRTIDWLEAKSEKLYGKLDNGWQQGPLPKEPGEVVPLQGSQDDVRAQLHALMDLTSQLTTNGHRGTEAQLAWCAQTIGRHLNAGTDMTTEEIARCMAVAEGQA